MSHQRFPLGVRLLHWIMAPLLIAMLLIGTGMVTTLSAWRLRLVGIHEPLGLALLVLALLRLALRLRGANPALPARLPLPLRLAAARRTAANASWRPPARIGCCTRACWPCP
jgi:cytochrome b561